MSDIQKIQEAALELHKTHHGKIEVTPKMQILTNYDLALAYTPGVGAVSSLLGKHPELASEYTLKHNTVAVISDGSAVLGLGNIGAEGAIPVMEGKALLFKELAGVDAFPICLRTQDPDEIIETIINISPVFAAINLEDISAPNCFYIEKELKKRLNIPVVHDDQHGTAVVVLAGLTNAIKLRGWQKEEARIVINGAGAAGISVAELLHEAGFGHITVCDSKGIVGKHRSDLNSEKQQVLAYTNLENTTGTLENALEGAHIFIGLSAAGALKPEYIQHMQKEPIIFALANPIPEILPDEAYAAGAFLVATGRSDYPNQINNALTFPGIFRGALQNKISQITNTHFIKAAEVLANMVGTPSKEHILPDVLDKRVSVEIAKVII